MNDFLVSVIIPVYNAATHVEKAVQSVVDIPEVDEVFLVDDGSQDNSLAICQTLQRRYKKVCVIQHPDKKNHGAAASRNLGILKARCEYIAFLDSDDYYLPHRFEREKHVFAQYPDADGVYGCNMEVFASEKAKELYFSRRSSVLTTITEQVAPENLYRCLLFGGVGEFHTSTITIRKHAFEKAGLFNTAIRYIEDTELWLKLAVSCRLYPGSIDEVQTIRIIHDTNSIHEWEKIKPYRDLMFQSLFSWIIKQQVPHNVKNDFFTALYYHFKNESNSAFSIFWNQVIRNPSMIFSSFFYKKMKQFIIT